MNCLDGKILLLEKIHKSNKSDTNREFSSTV